MLWEEGRFQPSDPVYKFTPSWRSHQVWVEGAGDKMATRLPKTPMTMVHILTHTAGFTYGGIPGLGHQSMLLTMEWALPGVAARRSKHLPTNYRESPAVRSDALVLFDSNRCLWLFS